MVFACAAHKARLPLVVCHLGQVWKFAKAAGEIAKTDALDAQDIAHFGAVLKPRLTQIKLEKLRKVSRP